MANRFHNGDVPQLSPLACASQHQATPAHVSAPDEFDWENQPFTKDADERLDVLWCRDASE